MHSLLKRYGLAGLSFAACAITAAAQPQGPPDAWARLARLAPGSEIRVTLNNGRTLHGFLQSATSDSLTLSPAMRGEPIPRPEIRRVQFKGPGHRGRNTLIGLAAGVAGGLAIGAYLDGRGHVWLFNPNDGKKIFSGVGAVLGTVTGFALPTGGWREIYRAP